jgi:hypothetical protein
MRLVHPDQKVSGQVRRLNLPPNDETLLHRNIDKTPPSHILIMRNYGKPYRFSNMSRSDVRMTELLRG